MKKVLLVLISILSLQSLSLKASEMRKIQALGREIQQELEKNLAIEFKKCSDSIFENTMVEGLPELEKNLAIEFKKFSGSIFENKMANGLNDQKRFQANSRVDLMKVLDVSMDEVMISKIEVFIERFNAESKKLTELNPAKVNEYLEIQKNGVPWPHSQFYREVMDRGEFKYRPMPIKRDRMVCDGCRAEASGLQEDEDTIPASRENLEKYRCDLPEYCHKSNCLFISSGLMRITCATDSRVSVQQRIKYALANNLLDIRNGEIASQIRIREMRSKFAESLDRARAIPTIQIPEILSIISAYIPFTNIKTKLEKFTQFYSSWGLMFGSILLEEFLTKSQADPTVGEVR